MSNHLAIATVTACLVQILDKAIRGVEDMSVSGDPFGVSSVRPSDRNHVTKRGVNVFLHHVTPNPHWRNADQPSRRADGSGIQRPQIAVDLHYVLTFYGD